MSLEILCEGPHCNGGLSAKDRERTIADEMPTQTTELREEANRHARLMTTKALRLTPHSPLGMNRGGRLIYSCDECGFERIYGNSYWSAV